MKKLVVLDGETLGREINIDLLKEFGEVVYYDLTNEEDVKDRIKDANIVITNKVVLNEDNLCEAENLEIICESATGYNNIDVEYAKKNNIAVTNVAKYSTQAVIQLTFAMALNLYNKIGYFDDYVKSGAYSLSGKFTNVEKGFEEICGKIWGIIGLGNIGSGVASVAEAFGAHVVYYSTSGKNNNDKYERVELDELLAKSDIVSIHSPLNADTRGLIDYEKLKLMKKNAILINVGRGSIVVEKDLARAIDEDLILGAGVDVFDVEPIAQDNPLLNVKNKEKLILTPHIAWASIEARKRLLLMMIDNIRAFYRGEEKNRVDKK